MIKHTCSSAQTDPVDTNDSLTIFLKDLESVLWRYCLPLVIHIFIAWSMYLSVIFHRDTDVVSKSKVECSGKPLSQVIINRT